MPAIDLVRLRREALALVEYFHDPPGFLRQLKQVFENHATHAYRRGETQRSSSTLPTFRVPPAVLKQLHFELEGEARAQPEQALVLVDLLWVQRSIEHRILAARLLGSISAESADRVMERLTTWVGGNREEDLLVELAQNGSATLRREQPGRMIDFARQSLGSGDTRRQSLALLVLKPLLTHSKFTDLPILFEILEPLAANPPKPVRPYFIELLQALAQRSPLETLFFLEIQIAEHPGEGARWLTRQALKFLPLEGQDRLNSALRSTLDKNENSLGKDD